MRGKPLALVAVLLAAAAGIFLLWRAIESGGAAPEAAPRAVEAERASDAPAISSTPLESAEGVDRSKRAEESFARTESFLTDGSTSIAGRVVFPDGSPPDETVEVWAFETELAIGMSDSFANAPELARRGELEKGWWSRRPVEADGSFRVPLPKGATGAGLLVDGRYLFLAEAARVEIGAGEPVVLHPALGAWIVGRCTLPANAEPQDAPFGASVRVGVSRLTRIGPDLAFEVRGAPPQTKGRVVVWPARLAQERVHGLVFEAGAKREVEVALRFAGRVSGRVVDEQGTGLARAALAFEPETFNAFAMELTVDDLEHAGPHSGPDGSFELFGLPATKSRVRAEMEGFVDGTSEPLQLQDGEVRRGITIVLSRGHGVAGLVSWPDGSPAVGANVVASSIEKNVRRGGITISGMPSVRSARTDRQGKFAITGLGEEPTTLSATCLPPEAIHPQIPGENPPTWYAILEDVPASSEGLSLVLRAPVGLAGRVVDDLDRPVAKFDAHVRAPDDEFGSSNRTHYTPSTAHVEDSKDGSFLLTGLQEGRWAVEIEAEGYVQTGDMPVVDVPRTEGPLLLRVERTGSVAGTVFDPSGTPVQGAEVSAARGSGGFLGSGEEEESAETDEKGAFLIENLRPGSVSLVARKEDQASSDSLNVLIEPEKRLEGQVLRLRRGGRLTGEVFDSRGARAAGRNVQVMGIGGDDQRQAAVADDGTFAIESLSPGTYQVMLEPTEEDQQRIMTSVEEGGEFDPSEFFSSLKMTSAEIREGETTHVVLGAPPKAPVRLFGRVTRSGDPVPRGMVVCIGEGGPVLSKMKMARVNAAGDYAVTLDEPGDYLLGYQDTVDESGGGPDFSVSVPETAEFRFDLELPTGGIRGIVRGPDGRGLEGVHVSLRRGGNQGSRLLTDRDGGEGTDTDGRFEFLGLPAGTYAVAAPSQGGFFGEEAPRWGRVVAGGLVVAKDEILSGVELRLTASCKISGIVRDGNGSPLADATVFARDERGHAVETLSTCRTDGSGSFTCEGLAAGSYTLFARTDSLATPESPPVVAREGEAARVELAAVPGTILIVSFEDREGRKLRGDISVRDGRGREVTGFQGIEGLQSLISEGVDSSVQRVGPLPPGEYQASATAADGRSARKPVELRGQEERSVKLRAD